MEVNGTSTNGAGVCNAFNGSSGGWGGFNTGFVPEIPYYFAVMSFEKPLRIVGLRFRLNDSAIAHSWFRLFGIDEREEVEDPAWRSATGGDLLGELQNITGPSSEYKCLVTINRNYYKRYRIEFRECGAWRAVYDIRLDALYRPADL